MAKLVKFKPVLLHPEHHQKLKRLAEDNYRSMVGQLEYMIDAVYNDSYSYEDINKHKDRGDK